MLNFFYIRAIYEITWKNIVQPDRPQVTIWRMLISCWILEATNTYSQYVIVIAFPLQQWLHERASVLCYMNIACPVMYLHASLTEVETPLCFIKVLTLC